MSPIYETNQKELYDHMELPFQSHFREFEKCIDTYRRNRVLMRYDMDNYNIINYSILTLTADYIDSHSKPLMQAFCLSNNSRTIRYRNLLGVLTWRYLTVCKLLRLFSYFIWIKIPIMPIICIANMENGSLFWQLCFKKFIFFASEKENKIQTFNLTLA